GWRYPFFCAFMVNVVALFARLRLVATPEFGALLERHELEPVKMTELLRVHGRDVLIGAFVPLASFATFHLVTVFPLSWMTRYSGSALTSDLSWLIGAGFAPFVALSLSSQFGLVYTSLYLLSGVVCTLVAIFFSKTLETRDT